MKATRLCFLLILISLTITASTSADMNQAGAFQGEWINVDPQRGGLTRLLISKESDGWSIEAWGKCHPRDCDWGKVALKPVGESTSDRSFHRGFAIWDSDFGNKYMTVRLDGAQLIAETITIFKDGSGRSHYRTVDALRPADSSAGNEESASSQPEQLSPPDGSVFNHYPRATTLKWKPVAGATRYGLEIDCFHCCTRDEWCTDVGSKYRVVDSLRTTEYSFQYVGAQPGRWRVWAIFPDGSEGPKTGWWKFSYTR